MTLSKWVMKQYWRVGTIRALLGLALGMFVLGKYYYVFVPVLSDMDVWGALILGTTLFLVFMGIGWFYDVKAKLWNESVVVQTERYPYSFVPEFRSMASDYPTLYSLLWTLKEVFERLELDTARLRNLSLYLEDYFKRQPSNRSDILGSEKDAYRFIRENPIAASTPAPEGHKYSIGTRIKRSFQLWTLRLNYTQSFTGLGQDVLVFGAVYVAIIFPEVATEGIVPMEYLLQGILFLSIPIFIVMVFAGWFYDKKLKLWSPDLSVQIERNPYSYVPDPRTHALTFPMFYTLLKLMNDVFIRLGLDRTEILKVSEYLDEFLKLNVSRQEDMKTAIDRRDKLGKLFQSPEEMWSDE